jgi:hypothetical protein
VNQALGNVFLSPAVWTDEIFIGALSDALIQCTRPALYDQLDMVTTATDQRLKAESTAAIREWAASAISCMLTLPLCLVLIQIGLSGSY